MLSSFYARQFKRDFKLQKKRGKDIQDLQEVMTMLIHGQHLPARNRDHPLKGRWSSFRECHVEPDWLLIYKIERNEIYFVRTGTHADLFE